MPTYIVQVRAIRHLTAELTVEAENICQARAQVAKGFGYPNSIKWDESDPEDEQIESAREDYPATMRNGDLK
ncbi:hypothetical protein [Rhizobium sp. SSA_523]|uniref:hypothetical protein n=1 Tax=Rhizobium sp. SSA_523 TaxID=2952477 RepID=UPI002090F1B6|nr:hypothetical protein [Rhizobium sp. SSA_523]MCO5730102.1 hypothetical protein [Rhizobium sp. SSA_523]WKC25167.1 hypothetical protein QTJ18_14360 [Rhizobium sp. SSA_523]